MEKKDGVFHQNSEIMIAMEINSDGEKRRDVKKMCWMEERM